MVLLKDAEDDVEELAHDGSADGLFGFAAREQGVSPTRDRQAASFGDGSRHVKDAPEAGVSQFAEMRTLKNGSAGLVDSGSQTGIGGQ